jgi:hypothetical protein
MSLKKSELDALNVSTFAVDIPFIFSVFIALFYMKRTTMYDLFPAIFILLTLAATCLALTGSIRSMNRDNSRMEGLEEVSPLTFSIIGLIANGLVLLSVALQLYLVGGSGSLYGMYMFVVFLLNACAVGFTFDRGLPTR